LFALKGTVGRGSWLLFLMTVAQSVSTVFLAFTLNRHLGLAPVRVGLVLITLSLSWSVAALPISGIGSVSKRQVIMRYGPLSQVCGAVLVGTGLYMELLPLVILGQMLNGAAFAMVFASASQAIIEAADPDHRMTTSALLPALETSGYVAGASLIGGAGSLLGFQDGLAAGHPPAGLFALWGVAALIALLAFVAARSVHLKRPDEVL
jgi:hypothetical protein